LFFSFHKILIKVKSNNLAGIKAVINAILLSRRNPY